MHETGNNSTLVEKLLQSTQKKEVFEAITKVSKQQTNQITNKVLEQIDNGVISLSVSQSNCNHYINHRIKEEALKNIYESDEYYNYERDLSIMKGIVVTKQIPPTIQQRKKRKKALRQQQLIMQKKSAEQIKRQFIQKVRAWQEQKFHLQKRKNDIQMKKKNLQISSEEKKIKQKEQIKAFLKLQKKKIIQGKLKEIQERKLQRQQILQLSSVKKSQSLPKYVEAQKKHKNLQKQKQIQNQILLKNRKQELQLKMKQIKQHEQAYIQRIKDRLQIQSQNKSIVKQQKNSISKSVQSFNINKKDPIQLKKIEEKIKRIKKIQNKIRLMPLKIDEQKRKQMQIMGDKLKNKKKYNFLSQKALSDELIYQQFKEFDINIDKKQLGNQYFQEFKSQPKRKVSSQKVLPTNQPQYKNYLQQMRQNKKVVLNPNQFDSIALKVNKMKDKSAGRNYLQQKSQHFEQKALQKIHELKKMQNYHDAVRKQQQIDKNYMKAIQAKLALAKVQ